VVSRFPRLTILICCSRLPLITDYRRSSSHVITLPSTIGAAEARRARGEPGGARRPPLRAQSDDYAGETELSKLIRYGCLFELEVHQMEEQRHLQAENTQLRRKRSAGSR
jgi:hypothetical protein